MIAGQNVSATQFSMHLVSLCMPPAIMIWLSLYGLHDDVDRQIDTLFDIRNAASASYGGFHAGPRSIAHS